MQAILAVTVPFFALVLLGWIAARAGWLPESAIPGLNAYVLFFALPCMLFRFGASLPFGAARRSGACSASTCVCGAAMVALTIAVTLRTRRRRERRRPARRRLRRARRRVPERRLHGRAAAGRAARRGRRRPGDRRDRRSTWSSPARSASRSRRRRAARSARRRRAAMLRRRAALAARRADQPAAVGDRPRRRVRGASACELPGPVGADRPHARRLGRRRSRCSRSAPCCWRAGSTPTRARRSRHYLPVALIKLFVHPALVFGLGLAARRARRAGVGVRPDGADPDRGAAEREQRLAAGRALRRRQRPDRADHHGLDGAGVPTASRLIAWAFEIG